MQNRVIDSYGVTATTHYGTERFYIARPESMRDAITQLTGRQTINQGDVLALATLGYFPHCHHCGDALETLTLCQRGGRHG